MPKATVTFKGKMAFDGVSDSGHHIVMDSAPEVGGENQGVRPMEMVLIGLGGCTGMDVVSMLNKMRVDYQTFDMEIVGDRTDEHPKVYEHITIRYRFDGDPLAVDKVVRAVTLSQEKYCSVSAMLEKSARIDAEVMLNGDVVAHLSQGGKVS